MRIRQAALGARLGGVRIGHRTGYLAAIAALGILGGGTCVLLRDSHPQPEGAHADPQAFAAAFQRYSVSEVSSMNELGATLPELADGVAVQSDEIDGDVVGSGTVTDLRLAYAETFANPGDGSTSELRHMYLAVDPRTVTQGRESLGQAGEVLIDLPAPPVDRRTDDRGLDEMRGAIVGSRVVFVLDESRPGDAAAQDESIADPAAGRSAAEPIFAASFPSTLIAVEGGDAFPLLTDEVIPASRPNLRFLEAVDVDADQFVSPTMDVVSP